MKNNITRLFYALLGLSFLIAPVQMMHAQLTAASNDYFRSVENLVVRDKTLYKSFAEGSPFINEKFESARFKRFGNLTYMARYNANLGDIEVQLDDRVIALNKNQSFEVLFLNTKKLYKNYPLKVDGKTISQFFVVLFENAEYSVLKKEYIKFRPETTAQTGYDKGQTAAWLREDDTFYLKIGDSIEELPTRRGKFLNSFPQAGKSLKSFIKKEKIDLSNEMDLVKTINHIMDTYGAE